MRGSSGLRLARKPSIDSAAAIWVAASAASASTSASAAAPADTAELEQIASPSLGPSVTG